MNPFAPACVCIVSAATTALAEPEAMDPVLAKYGDRVEAAVDRGLAYLAGQQSVRGTFKGSRGESCGIVALAGMAFLAQGHTPGAGPHGDTLNRCVDWVLANQQPSGLLNHSAADKGMYSHNIATLFLAEVSGMVDPARQERLDEVFPRAVALILQAQKLGGKDHRHEGGWRYTPDSWDSDLSCSGWALMALRSARLNGARVPDEAIAAAVAYILGNRDRHAGSFGYQDGRNHATTLTGAALLCLELTGRHRDDTTRAAGRYILKTHTGIAREQFAYYGVYYAAQGTFQLGGEAWETFADWMYRSYLPEQRADGSWHHIRAHESDVYYTAMMTLSFTVPYRQLPIYQRDESELE